MLKLRSVKSIVIAPAKTGRDKRSKIAVTNTDHTNRGIFSKYRFGFFIFLIVAMKLIAPRIEEIPAR